MNAYVVTYNIARCFYFKSVLVVVPNSTELQSLLTLNREVTNYFKFGSFVMKLNS